MSRVTRIQRTYHGPVAGSSAAQATQQSDPPSPPRSAQTAAPPDRLVALDVFRGLTVAGMLLVNNPGRWETTYPALRHAAWHGCTPTDLVFPFFLFIVGVTTALALGARARAGTPTAAVVRQVLRRGGLLLLVGLALNWFPFYHSGPLDGVANPGVLARLGARFHEMRIPGVLPRIAVVYVAAALVAWRASARRLVAVTAGLLLGYWALLTLVPVPGEGLPGAALLDAPGRTLAAWVDRRAFDWSAYGLGNHLWGETRTYDPEGVLATLPSVATAVLGVLAGRWLTSARPLGERLRGFAAAGAAGAAAGLAWGLAFPLNKQLWTSSYVLFAGGLAALALAAAAWAVDAHGWRRGVQPLVVYGTNPLVAFAGSEVMAHLVHATFKVRVEGRRVGLEQAITRWLELAGLAPRAASLGYALLFVLAWYYILRALYRRGVFLRV